MQDAGQLLDFQRPPAALNRKSACIGKPLPGTLMFPMASMPAFKALPQTSRQTLPPRRSPQNQAPIQLSVEGVAARVPRRSGLLQK